MLATARIAWCGNARVPKQPLFRLCARDRCSALETLEGAMIGGATWPGASLSAIQLFCLHHFRVWSISALVPMLIRNALLVRVPVLLPSKLSLSLDF